MVFAGPLHPDRIWRGTAVNGLDSINPELEPIQGVCPDGWHLLSDGDWKELEMFLGMTALSADSTGWRGNIGGKLKSTGIESWLIPNTGATNETRFTALAAGLERVWILSALREG